MSVFRSVRFDWYSTYNPANVERIMARDGIARGEAIKMDIAGVSKERRFAFDLKTECIRTMLSRIVGRQKTDGVRIVIIQCMDGSRPEKVIYGSDGFCTVILGFDAWQIYAADGVAAKAMTVDLVERAFRLIGDAGKIDAAPFFSACQTIRRLGYRNE